MEIIIVAAILIMALAVVVMKVRQGWNDLMRGDSGGCTLCGHDPAKPANKAQMSCRSVPCKGCQQYRPSSAQVSCDYCGGKCATKTSEDS